MTRDRVAGQGNAAAGSAASVSLRGSLIVWLGLVLIVATEVLLTRAHLPPGTLLVALVALALIEAGIGLLYFMHLKYERPILFWSVIATLLFVFVMLNHVWPDAMRLLHLRMPTP